MPTSRTRKPREATRPDTETSFSFPFTTTTSVLLRGQEVTSGRGPPAPRSCQVRARASGVRVRVHLCCLLFLFLCALRVLDSESRRLAVIRSRPPVAIITCLRRAGPAPAPAPAPPTPQPARAHLRGPSLARTRAPERSLPAGRVCLSVLLTPNTHGSGHARREHAGETPLSAHVTCWLRPTPQSIRRGSRNSSTGGIEADCAHVPSSSCPRVLLMSSPCPRVLSMSSCPPLNKVPAPLQDLGSSHRRDRERDGPTDGCRCSRPRCCC